MDGKHVRLGQLQRRDGYAETIDVAADVNRASPEETSKLAPEDYGSIAREVSEFCTHPSRGLEQVYEVIRQATQTP